MRVVFIQLSLPDLSRQTPLMQQGMHYKDVHAPVPAVTTFRVFMMGVALQGRSLHHWDVKTAFLTTPMDCQIDEAFNAGKDLQPEARRAHLEELLR